MKKISNCRFKVRDKDTGKEYNVRTIIWLQGNIDQIEIYTGDSDFSRVIDKSEYEIYLISQD